MSNKEKKDDHENRPLYGIRLQHPASLPFCPICNEPVRLENSKTDGNGKAVHEECYLWSLTSKLSAQTTEAKQ
jgi:hypothetical protein